MRRSARDPRQPRHAPAYFLVKSQQQGLGLQRSERSQVDTEAPKKIGVLPADVIGENGAAGGGHERLVLPSELGVDERCGVTYQVSDTYRSPFEKVSHDMVKGHLLKHERRQIAGRI
jgi:hypothetical protein